MKTIVQNSTKLSCYLYDDSAVVTMGSDSIEIEYTENGITQSLVVIDRNSSTDTLYENVTDVPEDSDGNSVWVCRKYTYEPAADPKWVANPDWEDPEA